MKLLKDTTDTIIITPIHFCSDMQFPTHTGIKASYSFSQAISGMIMIVNGWDNSIDSNTSKSVGGEFIVNPIKEMNISVNYMFGPEKANNNSDNRSLLDVVG